MKNSFLENSSLGKNEWWRYALTILVVIIFTGAFTVIGSKGLIPFIKANFEKSPFAETIVNFLMLFGIFGSSLLGLALMINKAHKRSFSTLIHTNSKFSWKLWVLGFLAWCPVVVGLGFLTAYGDFERFLALKFSINQVLVIFFVGLIAVGIQSTAEEILF